MSQFALQKWHMANGDNTIALEFALKDTSVVVDTSGVSGDWAYKMYKKYKCNIYIFEPVRRYFTVIKKRFENIDKVVPMKFMLSNRSGESEMYLKEEASTSYKNVSNVVEKIQLMDISEFRKNEQLQTIDLLRLNVNGEEYNIFDRIFSKMMHTKIKYIMVQFSPLPENAIEKRDAIRKRLEKTHREVYNYEFVWELWELK